MVWRSEAVKERRVWVHRKWRSPFGAWLSPVFEKFATILWRRLVFEVQETKRWNKPSRECLGMVLAGVETIRILEVVAYLTVAFQYAELIRWLLLANTASLPAIDWRRYAELAGVFRFCDRLQRMTMFFLFWLQAVRRKLAWIQKRGAVPCRRMYHWRTGKTLAARKERI